MSKFKQQDTRPLGGANSWARTPGTWISAQAHIAGVDHVAVTMELKWGVGRLRLLVDTSLREKFDRQRYLFNAAIWHGDLQTVSRESARMTAAWQALDKAAEASGANPLSPVIWETVLEDGTVAAIVRTREEAHAIGPPWRASAPRTPAEARKVAVYTLDEIARILSHHTAITEAKLTFPGATVEAVRRPSDPLDRFADTAGGLDDPIEDILQIFGA